MAWKKKVTKAEINDAMRNVLKYAPDRLGGGGRKDNTNTSSDKETWFIYLFIILRA